jgi:hypothetical protein
LGQALDRKGERFQVMYALRSGTFMATLMSREIVHGQGVMAQRHVRTVDLEALTRAREVRIH